MVASHMASIWRVGARTWLKNCRFAALPLCLATVLYIFSQGAEQSLDRNDRNVISQYHQTPELNQKHCNFPANSGWPSSAEVEDKPCLDHGGILACTKIACALWELAWNSAIVFRFVPGLYASIAGAVYATFAATSYELRLFLSVAGAICQADAASFCDTDGCFAKPGQVKSLCFFWKGLRALHVPVRFNLCQRSTLTDSWEGALIYYGYGMIWLRYATAMVWTLHA